MKDPVVRLDSSLLSDVPTALSYEWLETNGLGGYAMGTPLLSNSRKYHSLLAIRPSGLRERHSLLANLDIELSTAEGTFALGTNMFPGAIHPTGYEYVDSFTSDMFPETRFLAGKSGLAIALLMPFGLNAVIFRFLLDSGDAALRIRPFLAYREIHHLAIENAHADPSFRKSTGGAEIRPYLGMPTLRFVSTQSSSLESRPDWYRSFEYRAEKERGYDFREDLMTPGIASFEISDEAPLYLAATIDELDSAPEDLWDREVARRSKRRESYRSRFEGIGRSDLRLSAIRLAEGAGQFLIGPGRASAPSVIAGFPWFGEWGRDSMISVEGLALSLDDYVAARSTLETFAVRERDGLFPNQLDVYGESSYNTVDASLWYFSALHRFVRAAGGSPSELPILFGAMKRILAAYFDDRVPDATILKGGLLHVGSEETQLTWMDATVDGRPVTPRHGMPVEINALWYNALSVWNELAADEDRSLTAKVRATLDGFEERFEATFWVREGFLADVVSEAGDRDLSIRPNQVIALSLLHSPVDGVHARTILDTVEAHLLTPFGLRTLSPSQYNYSGIYEGTQNQRDAAYHQGTVWPWLVGHFVEAMERYFAGESARLERVALMLEPLFAAVGDNPGLGSISEVYDGDPPHRPGGCPMQAWSVAETLRALIMLHGQD